VLTDDEIDSLIAAQPAGQHRAAILAGVLRRVRRCSLCRDIFRQKKDLEKHLSRDHAKQLANSTSYEVGTHDVSEGAHKVYVCAFCGYAVSDPGLCSPYSRISDHVATCAAYGKQAHSAHKSFHISEDTQLIRAYTEGHAQIEVFLCPVCDDSFASSRSLIPHLAKYHSDARWESLPDEQRARIENLLDRSREQSLDSVTPRPSTDSVCAAEEPQTPWPPSDARPGPPRGDRPRSSTPPTSAAVSLPPHRPSPTVRPVITHEFSRTLSQGEVDKGYCDVPSGLRALLGLTDKIVVGFQGGEESTLEYRPLQGRLLGFASWYLGNALEAADRVFFRVIDVSIPRLAFWTKWECNLDQLLRCPPEDFDWAESSIRDCLLRVLSESQEPLYYRSLYAEISKHRALAPGSVLGVLSKYRGVLFVLTKRGMWELMHDNIRDAQEGKRVALNRSPQELRDQETEVWLTVVAKDIEDHDLVYRLLRRSRQDMSYTDICRELAAKYHASCQALCEMRLFDASDARLKRLTNGNFALVEWFEPALSPDGDGTESEPIQPQGPEVPPEEPPPNRTGRGTKPEHIALRAWSLLRRCVFFLVSRIVRKKVKDGYRA